MCKTASLSPGGVGARRKHDVLVISLLHVRSNMGIRIRLDGKQSNG